MGKKGLWFLARAVAMLILIGLVVAGGFAIHYISWSQGYSAGQLAGEGEEAATPPYFPGGPEYFLWHSRAMYRPFGVIGVLFKIGLCILFFAVVCKLIRFVIWGSVFRHVMAGPWAKSWGDPRWPRAYRRHARWHRVHGPPMPPWCWDWDEEDEETDKEPDAED
jgi:hypothetical protein